METMVKENTEMATTMAPAIMEKAEVIVMDKMDDAEKLKELALLDKGFSEAQLAEIKKLTEQINITDSTAIISYGAGAQAKVAEFADSALESVKTHDLGEVGNMVAQLVGELQGFSDELEGGKGIKALFKKAAKNVTVIKAKYEKAEKSVNSIVSALDDHQVTLLKDIAVLDRLFDTNREYFKEISMYIVAGKEKLEHERSTTLVELENAAKASDLPEDAQRANDFAELCNRFEKKIYDLELTRMVSLQMAPQIRLVQNNDNLMSEKIQSTIVNTIPLWKSQMIVTLGLAHSEEALKAERAVTDMTNQLLQKNAEKLHQSTVAIAQESERGIVDIETLTHTNQELIDTLDEVRQIQAEGRQKRTAAESELARIEVQLKDKLLEVTTH